MDIFCIISLLGGLAMFLYGMTLMLSGLEKLAGGKLETTLKTMTSSPIKGLILGAGITVAIQSSSAVTVMLVGLVNSGIMQLGQTVGVIMGSNIGTTLTAWILSVSGIDSGNVVINLLKPENFAPIIALIGVILMMTANRQRKKDIGHILIGFSILMFGMTMMGDAMDPLAEDPNLASWLTAFNNPLLGVLVGTVITGIIQSSAASVGMLQALSLTGGVSFGMAIPIIMGQNIGTCVTALISSIGVNRNARRVAIVHILFNLIGTIVCLILFMIARSALDLAVLDSPISPVGIAACHSIFNIFTTAILFPFSKKIVALAEKLIKSTPEEQEKFTFIDERLLGTPSVAVSESFERLCRMANKAQKAIKTAMNLFSEYTPEAAQQVIDDENALDHYEDKLGNFLTQVSTKDLSEKDSAKLSMMLYVIGDLERIGDHARNIQGVAQEKFEKDLHFTKDGTKDLVVLSNALFEIVDMAVQAIVADSVMLASRIEPLEEVIDDLVFAIRNAHVNRLKEGRCTIEAGFILSDLLTDIERISDHCSNIATAVFEMHFGGLERHVYLNTVKGPGNEIFTKYFTEYSEKYSLAK